MFCKTCGNQLKETQKFCARCGTKATVESNSKTESNSIDSAKPESVLESTSIANQTVEERVVAQPQVGKNQNEDQVPVQSESELDNEKPNPVAPVAVESDNQEVKAEPQELGNSEATETEFPEMVSPASNSVSEAFGSKPIISGSENEQSSVVSPIQSEPEIHSTTEPQVEPSIDTPLPDALVLFIRTKLLEEREFTQLSKDDLYLRTRAAGISDERTEFHLQREIEQYGVSVDEVIEEEQEKEQPKKRKWAGLFWIIGILFFLGLLLGLGYVFRSQVLDTMDNWGLQTTALRSTLVEDLPSDAVVQEPPVKLENLEDEQTIDIPENEEEISKPIEEEVITKAVAKSRQDDQQQQASTTKPQPITRPTSQAQMKPMPKPTVYTVVDKSPEYPGGNNALQAYIDRNILYPPEARRQNQTGTVYLRYVVKADGTIGEVEVVSGVASSLVTEAIRVIKSIQGFSPGYKDGKAVDVYQNGKVRFMLE